MTQLLPGELRNRVYDFLLEDLEPSSFTNYLFGLWNPAPTTLSSTHDTDLKKKELLDLETDNELFSRLFDQRVIKRYTTNFYYDYSIKR